ncbi:CDP-alcohol phosphatidyltransferase [Marinobacter salinus]|uniref:CDP-alcohol phosphatidyltransferase n=1 Tax=Marinobacter salinus TaxID=1874317 RepID=A0A1D9GIL8_9GAMM|nr:CDP-alcohol phosphatidyltransferase family protein [Marinobacter salinus]AOY87487.1 CDP-alcohol phosphatidyltransferase [Marinobacter salinus]
MDPNENSGSIGVPPSLDLVWGLTLTAFLCLGAVFFWALPDSLLYLAGGLYAALSGCVLKYWPTGRDFGWANRVTLLRGAMIISLFAIAPYAGQLGPGLWLYSIVALVALILDGVDGSIARKTDSRTTFGARFDMELDALLILGLCIAVIALERAGIWVIALGLMRYAFVIATLSRAWLDQPLPDSFRRKTVCVWQVVTLMVAIVPPVPPLFASATLAIALVLLAWSFFVDVRWLYQRSFYHETV